MRRLAILLGTLIACIISPREPAKSAYPGSPPLIVTDGGTGATTLTAHGMLIGEGTAAIVAMAPVADSVFVQGSASSDPATAGTSATADSVLGWGAAGTTPTAVSLGSTCASALTYNTTTHAFACTVTTQYNVQVASTAGAAFTQVAPGTAGIPLISSGAAANPAFSTAVVAGGGTGATTLTAHGILVGEGTSAVVAVAPVADSVVVWGSATSDPTTAGTSATADSPLGWGAAGTTPAPMTGLTSCSGATNALTYNTGTHAFGCNSLSAGGVALSTVASACTATFTVPTTNGLTQILNTGTACTTINLPASQANGFRVCVKDGTEAFGTNPATVKVSAGNIDGTVGTTGLVNFFNMNKQENCFISDGTNYFVE